MIKIRHTFAVKVVRWVLLLAVPVFFASVGVLFWQSRKMVRTESIERANGVLSNTLQRINRYLITAETATNINAWQVEEQLTPEALKRLTDRIVRLNPYIDGCNISTEPGLMPQYPNGFMALTIREGDSVRTTSRTDYDYFSTRWYTIPRVQEKPCWVLHREKDNKLNLNENGMIATYSYPLRNADGHFIGIVSTELSLLHISQILAEERPYPHSYFALIDEQGRYIGHPDTSRLFDKTIFSVADAEQQTDLIALGYEMTGGKRGSMSVEVNDEPCMVCYMPVEGTTWSLAIVCLDSDVFHGYQRLTYMMIALLFIGLLLIIINCYKAVTTSLHPLGELLEKTRAVAQGDMEVKIAHTERTDIIGGLQNSFATMLQSVNYYIDSVHTATDQTKRYNTELEKATQLAIEAERRKTTFIQNVSHQVRTPLNVIMGYAQVLRKPTDRASLSDGMAEEDIKAIVNKMEHNCKKLVRTVLMLFDSSDTGLAASDKRERRDMIGCNELCREAYTFINRMYHVPIAFETELSDDFRILTNHRDLLYSLQELLGNATRYSDGKNVLLRAEKDDKSVRFIIQDTGKGIAEADLENIFMFFTKVDDFSDGLGLGLPLVKRHAETLGGSFTLDTSYHAGCRFIFELPIQ